MAIALEGVRISNEKPRSSFIQAAEVASVGLEMGVAVTIGYFGGVWLDNYFDTSPYLMIFLLLCGVGAGFKGLFRAGRQMREQSKKQSDEQEHQS